MLNIIHYHIGIPVKMLPHKNHYKLVVTFLVLMNWCTPKNPPNAIPHLMAVHVNGNRKIYLAFK